MPDMDLLFRSWQLRKLDPFAFFRFGSRCSPWLRSEAERIHRAKQETPEAFQEVKRYFFRAEYWDAECQLEAVSADFVPSQVIVRLQDQLIRKINDKKIVIEVMPTSNLCISAYTSYGQHHAVRWLMENSRPRSLFAVGSDDPGVFHTTIRNEYLLLAKAAEESGYDVKSVYRLLGEVCSVGRVV